MVLSEMNSCTSLPRMELQSNLYQEVTFQILKIHLTYLLFI